MNDIENILKAALSPRNTPSEELNNKIRKQVMESGKMSSMKKNLITAAAIIISLLILPTAVYAAYKYLSPKEAANYLQDTKLGDAFDNDGTEVLQTVTEGSYKVTYLGHVTGESISERTGSSWELNPERLYVAVAIERADGTEISNPESLFVSPLIQGLKPWQFNIASMNGSYSEKIINGVLYRIIECDDIEIFADKKLYLAVSDTSFYSNEAYHYDEETGLISANETYQGTNILFDMQLDPTKADPAKAAAYIKQLTTEWNEEAQTNKRKEAQENNPRIQQEVFTDKENGLTFHIKDNDSSRWWGDDISSQTIFSYYFDVEGDGIESLTYTLNQGEFGSYPKNKPDESKSYGAEYSISYDDQKNINYFYSILINAKYTDYGYNNEDLSKLGMKDLDAREKIYYEVLSQEINATKIDLEIKKKDGKTIDKTLSFHNILDVTDRSFWIAVTVE